MTIKREGWPLRRADGLTYAEAKAREEAAELIDQSGDVPPLPIIVSGAVSREHAERLARHRMGLPKPQPAPACPACRLPMGTNHEDCRACHAAVILAIRKARFAGHWHRLKAAIKEMWRGA